MTEKLPNELDRTALARLPAEPGLCGRCRHLRLLGSPRSVFVRCGLAEEERAFARYPPLPVLACTGFVPVAEDGEP